MSSELKVKLVDQNNMITGPFTIEQIAKLGMAIQWDNVEAVLRYIGIKDCNGEEIYEADLVKTRWTLPRNEYCVYLGKVTWCVYGLRWIIEWVDQIDGTYHSHSLELRADKRLDKIQIVGNDFEGLKTLLDENH